MWWDRRKLSTYHKVVRVIAGLMVVVLANMIVRILLAPKGSTDPIIKWAILLILAIMLVLSALMFRSPSRDP